MDRSLPTDRLGVGRSRTEPPRPCGLLCGFQTRERARAEGLYPKPRADLKLSPGRCRRDGFARSAIGLIVPGVRACGDGRRGGCLIAGVARSNPRGGLACESGSGHAREHLVAGACLLIHRRHREADESAANRVSGRRK